MIDPNKNYYCARFNPSEICRPASVVFFEKHLGFGDVIKVGSRREGISLIKKNFKVKQIHTKSYIRPDGIRVDVVDGTIGNIFAILGRKS